MKRMVLSLILCFLFLLQAPSSVLGYENAVSYDRIPFYGIWCGASKSEGDMLAVADTLRQNGFSPEVLITTDWDNLNTEFWYVVTAGLYSTEGAAAADLDRARSLYPDAYIKYSGNFQGTSAPSDYYWPADTENYIKEAGMPADTENYIKETGMPADTENYIKEAGVPADTENYIKEAGMPADTEKNYIKEETVPVDPKDNDYYSPSETPTLVGEDIYSNGTERLPSSPIPSLEELYEMSLAEIDALSWDGYEDLSDTLPPADHMEIIRYYEQRDADGGEPGESLASSYYNIVFDYFSPDQTTQTIFPSNVTVYDGAAGDSWLHIGGGTRHLPVTDTISTGMTYSEVAGQLTNPEVSEIAYDGSYAVYATLPESVRAIMLAFRGSITEYADPDAVLVSAQISQ